MNYKNRILALLLIVMLFVPVLPTKVEAQFGIPTVDQGLNPKEVGITAFGVVIPGLTMDLIAITIARTLIESILNSTIDWINSGFEGNPSFVTDPERFFENIADGIAGEFIAGSDLGFLCSPFQDQIRLSLQQNYVNRGDRNPQNRYQCTLSDVVGNIEGFYDNFSEGGWQGWFSMTQRSSNNPYGAYLEAQIDLDERIAERVGLQREQLSWDSGFISWAPCIQTNPDTGECIRRGPTQTPGVVIESQLEGVLGTGVRQLELADEFDELVSALIGQLLQRFVFGAGGLTGGGGGGGGSPPPPPPPINDPRAPTIFINANPITVPLNGVSTITWSSTNASYCVASGGWSGPRALSGTETTGSLTASQAYTLTCTNTYGPTSRSVNVAVPGGGFGGGGGGALPVVTLSAERIELPFFTIASLDWTATNATSCLASGGWSGNKALSGDESVRVTDPVMTFVLTCYNGSGATTQYVSVQR